jgi:hypothetical protein
MLILKESESAYPHGGTKKSAIQSYSKERIKKILGFLIFMSAGADFIIRKCPTLLTNCFYKFLKQN